MSSRQQVTNRLLSRRYSGQIPPSLSASKVKLDETMVKRIKISTETVNFQATRAAKTNQAWKYPSNKIQRAPSIILGNTRYTDHKDPTLPRRRQESNFFVTINTNKSLLGDEYELGTRHLENVLSYLGTDAVVASFLRYGPKNEQYMEDRYADVVNAIEWRSCIETGPNKNRLHAHICLTITHYSQIQLNSQVLMHLTKKVFNDPTINPNNKYNLKPLGSRSNLYISKQPYVNIKLLPQTNWTDIMRQYIHKGMDQTDVCEGQKATVIRP